MLKNVSNLGKVLSKKEQQKLIGGIACTPCDSYMITIGGAPKPLCPVCG